MQEHTQHPCDSFLQQWNLRREVANYYFTALMRISPDALNAVGRRQELSEKLFAARLSIKHAEDQLHSSYQEHSTQELQWEGRGDISPSAFWILRPGTEKEEDATDYMFLH